MKSKRKFSHKKNFHIKTNDVFNTESVPLLTLKDMKRGKKHVENARLSNFNGISLNFDLNRQSKEHVLTQPLSDEKYRRFSNLRNKENHLTTFYSPVSISNNNHPIPNEHSSKTESNDIIINNVQTIKNKAIQYLEENKNSLQPSIYQGQQNNSESKLIFEKPISFGIKKRSIDFANKININMNFNNEAISPASNKEKIDQIMKNANEVLSQDRQSQSEVHSDHPNLEMHSQPKLSNIKVNMGSRNIINTSMQKDYNNLSYFTGNQQNKINEQQNVYYNQAKIISIQAKPRLSSAGPLASGLTVRSKIIIHISQSSHSKEIRCSAVKSCLKSLNAKT